MSGEAGDTAAQIIDTHRYFRAGRCRCGLELANQTHAQHVVHELQMAGLDIVRR